MPNYNKVDLSSLVGRWNMANKVKRGFQAAASFIFMIVVFYFLVVGLSSIESFYNFIGDKVPVIGRFIDWARNLLNM